MAAAGDYADSFLTRALSGIRKNIDEPITNAKYSDADLIRQLEFSYILVFVFAGVKAIGRLGASR